MVSKIGKCEYLPYNKPLLLNPVEGIYQTFWGEGGSIMALYCKKKEYQIMNGQLHFVSFWLEGYIQD